MWQTFVCFKTYNEEEYVWFQFISNIQWGIFWRSGVFLNWSWTNSQFSINLLCEPGARSQDSVGRCQRVPFCLFRNICSDECDDRWRDRTSRPRLKLYNMGQCDQLQYRGRHFPGCRTSSRGCCRHLHLRVDTGTYGTWRHVRSHTEFTRMVCPFTPRLYLAFSNAVWS